MARDFSTSGDWVSLGSLPMQSPYSRTMWIAYSGGSFGTNITWASDSHSTGVDAGVFNLNRSYDGGLANWQWPRPSDQGWHHYAVTHDDTVNTNVPDLYIDGVWIAPTTINPQSGNPFVFSTEHRIGRNPGGVARTSTIAMVGLYDVVLTRHEVLDAYRNGYTPRGLRNFVPLVGASSEPDLVIPGTTYTVTGTTVVADPPVTLHGRAGQGRTGALGAMR